jgi:hypothetical protein
VFEDEKIIGNRFMLLKWGVFVGGILVFAFLPFIAENIGDIPRFMGGLGGPMLVVDGFGSDKLT